MTSEEWSDPSQAEQQGILSACTRLPGAELTYPFRPDTPVFKVGGKMFAAISLRDEPARLTVKCDPEYGDFLVQQFDEVIPGYHMNKRHWITVILGRTLPQDMIEDLIAESYALVIASLSKHVRRSLDDS